jgi:hypothetical protein
MYFEHIFDKLFFYPLKLINFELLSFIILEKYTDNYIISYG